MDRIGGAELDLIAAYLNGLVGAGEHVLGAPRNLHCGDRPLDAGAAHQSHTIH